MKTIGDILINAIVDADALQGAEIAENGTVFIWRANAPEQIEAAIQANAEQLIALLIASRTPQPDGATKRPARSHTLKTLSPYFREVRDGRKPFEIRRFDRDFRIGDTLELIEVEPETIRETGEVVFRTISYMTTFAQRDGFVVLGIEQ
jgi:hypothetical protein